MDNFWSTVGAVIVGQVIATVVGITAMFLGTRHQLKKVRR